MFGWVKGTESKVNLSRFHEKAIQIANTPPGAQMRDPFPAAIECIDKGIFDLRPIVSHVVPLPEYPDLIRRILGGDRSYLKGVVKLEQ